MAARSVHVFFKNLTDETLVRDSEGLEWGIYTEPWFPPQTIAPGEVGEWQTESDGFMTGTEGHARYSLSNDSFTEFAELTWDNPYIGANSCSMSIKEDFSGAVSKVFEWANTIDKNVPPNWVKMKDGDVEAWIDGVLFPVYIFSNASSANDANAMFAIRRKSVVSSPLFGAPSDAPKSSRVNTALKSEEWAGLWGGVGVSVTLTALGGRNMSAHILDTTGDGELQLQENFTLGGHSWTTTALVVGVQNELRAANPSVVTAITQAAARSITGVRNVGHGEAASTVRSAVREALEVQGARLSEAKLTAISKTAAALATIPRSTVMLSHGIGLTLYDNFTGAHKSGGMLLYERVSMARGQRLVSCWLSFYPMLH
jgi:hypothetical protein